MGDRVANGLEEEEEENDDVFTVEVPLGEAAAETFDFEKTVCSHGLFMMSPNQWDPLSRTFSRPLRFSDSSSFMVSISHPSQLPHTLLVRVHGTPSLSPQHRESLLRQVVRMLRLSDTDERNAREFKRIVSEVAMGKGEFDWMNGGFSGRLFRSPTLFEDMVKCILLCNCQWSRTLSMATALCELQLERQCRSCRTTTQPTYAKNFIPKTPAGKEPKRKKLRTSKVSTNLAAKLLETKMELEADACLTMDHSQMKIKTLSPNFSIEGDSSGNCESCDASNKFFEIDPSAAYSLHSHRWTLCGAHKRICNFPSPEELAILDEKFLAKRCGLGYRAARIIKLAKGIVEGGIPLRELEEVCNGGSLCSYNKLAGQLKEIDGFGPFTRANVLMCMGYYHVIPADSETVRHLKQVHAKNSTFKAVSEHAEEIYGNYAPFQFLAYWAELWHFYEQRFGKFSEMPCFDYKLITASNMRNKRSCKVKRSKTS